METTITGHAGEQAVAAMKAVYDAAVAKNPGLGGTIVPPKSAADVASHAMLDRDWLETTARKALGLSELRRYHFGPGKEWNVKESIAFGAGPVHEDFNTDLYALGPAALLAHLAPQLVPADRARFTADQGGPG